jgi:hypothetical protein
MTDEPHETGPTPSADARIKRQKRTCLVCCSIGCLVSVMITGSLCLLYSMFLFDLLRSLIVSR